MKKLSKNSIRYYYFKLVKQSGSPEYNARGAAIGLFIGFLVPFGFQMGIALVLAFIFRASKILSMAFTWVTNYFTIFIIYPVQCYVGSAIMHLIMGNRILGYKFLSEKFEHLIHKPSYSALLDLGMEIVIPFFVGGFLFGVVSAFIGYFATYGMVLRYRQRKDRRLRHKLMSSAQKARDSQQE